MILKVTLTSLIFCISACSSGFLKYNGEKSITKNTDFEQKVIIKTTDPADTDTVTTPSPEAQSSTASPEKKKKVPEINKDESKLKAKTTKSSKKTKEKSVVSEVLPASTTRQPDLEDHAGFENGQRVPQKNPYRVGETVVHSVRYFATEAGTLTLKVKPFVEVNNRKSYNFLTDLKTSGIFSSFYSVDDQVETYVDYENLVPHVFKLHIKESGQLKEAQSFFDQKTLKATYWEHKFTEKTGHEEKKQEWDILPFSQNAFSGIFYMRIFAWEIGKEYSFRVSDDQKNIVFKAVAVKKEKLSTDAGEFDAIQIKARVVSRGALTQEGDIFFWVSDDDRKYVLRIEAKIKIGSLVSEVVKIIPGTKE